MDVNMNVVDIAKSQLGYQEIGKNNDSMYGKWYGLNNNPWCAMFVSWCFDQAGLVATIAAQTKKGFASCDAGLKWFIKNNKTVPVGKAQAGDIVFFQFDADAQADHVGICASNDGKKYLTVYEGNTSGDNKGSQSNGDGVYLKKRAYSLVMGVARP
jgi:cell wall-associated NlpC family hydrolase